MGCIWDVFRKFSRLSLECNSKYGKTINRMDVLDVIAAILDVVLHIL
jgi:hypothetical protein